MNPNDRAGRRHGLSLPDPYSVFGGMSWKDRHRSGETEMILLSDREFHAAHAAHLHKEDENHAAKWRENRNGLPLRPYVYRAKDRQRDAEIEAKLGEIRARAWANVMAEETQFLANMADDWR